MTNPVDDNKNEEKNKNGYIATISWLILLIIVFGTILKQVVFDKSIIVNLGFINIYSFGLKYELVYSANPNQYIFVSLFSLVVFIYCAQRLYVILKSTRCDIKFKPIYIFYIITFLGISFPFWFFVVAMLFPT